MAATSPFAGPDHHETTAAQARIVSVHHAQRQRGGHGAIDGIAARAHGVESRFSGKRMNGCGDGVGGGGGVIAVRGRSSSPVG